jgi:UDP-N-acetylglucosamine enolpyruvyl transferase
MEINAGFSVTATENILVANTLREGTTTIKMAAIEPHVMNLVDFLRKA